MLTVIAFIGGTVPIPVTTLPRYGEAERRYCQSLAARHNAIIKVMDGETCKATHRPPRRTEGNKK